MFSLNSSDRFLLYTKATDMRKGFDSLCGIVRNGLGEDPLSGRVYIFINRRRNSMKLLHWENGGLVLYYKRLEKGTFEFPVAENGTDSITLPWPKLVLLVEGFNVLQHKKHPRFERQ